MAANPGSMCTNSGTPAAATTNRNHPVHGYQSLIKDHPAIQSAEMTKYLKQNFVAPEKDPKYNPEYVIRKTSTSRALLVDTERWKSHFLRRRSHLEKGFFTPSYKSYSSVGYVELSPQQLVLDVFDDCLNKKMPLPSILTGKLPVKTPPHQDILRKDRKSPSHIQHSSTGGLDFNDEEIDSAGFSFIKQSLKESEKVLTANRGGQPFDQCVKEILANRDQSHEDEHQSAVTFLPPPLSLDEQFPLVPTMEIYAVPITSAPDPTRPCSKTRAAEEDREREQERMIFNRSKRLLLERLKMIQIILNALHNIKSKDLRSRVPLSGEAVKYLYRDVADKPFSSRTVKNDIHHSSNDTVNSNEKAPVVGGRTSKTVIPSKFSTLGRNDGLVSTTPTPQWKKHRHNIMHHKKELRIETWEDLITMTSPSNVAHRNSVFPNNNVTNMVGRLLGPHRHGDSHKLPLWQTISLTNEDSVKRPPVTHNGKGGSPRKHPDPENTLKSLIQNFNRVKKKMAREVHSDLEKLVRDRHRMFKQKFQCLNKSMLFEKTVQHMKGVSTAQPMQIITEDTNAEIKPSKWFTDLKSGAENIVGKDDKDVNKMLQQLSRFSLEDAKSIPNAKEKLCLLVMSMPASDLLTIPSQQALKYVLEEILWASSESLSQWLNHRKIPLILQQEQSVTH